MLRQDRPGASPRASAPSAPSTTRSCSAAGCRKPAPSTATSWASRSRSTEAWVSFRVGAALLSLRPRGIWSVCDDGPLPPGSAAVQLAFRVPPQVVDACHAELIAKGVPILRAPTDLPQWRHRTLFFRDPEDNLIGIDAEY